MINKTEEYLKSLVKEFQKINNETEWLEFKCNNNDPERIAKYISGLSNSAALCEKTNGYLLWGIDDKTHDVCGTSFNFEHQKKGNEELISWLTRMISPKINFKFYEVFMEKAQRVVILEIPAASSQPIKYQSTAYIRVGTNLKSLSEYNEKEAELWRIFESVKPELRIALYNVEREEIKELLDYPEYYRKMGLPIPENFDKVIDDLKNEKFIVNNEIGKWNITNLGALTIAVNIKKFENLIKRTVRVIWYNGKSRLEAIREKEFIKGYALVHEEIVQYIMTIIPQKEIIEQGIRKNVFSFPEIAIRELVANLMIHQSLEQHGTNPMVEVFEDRMEFSNAGAPLISIERILDTVPVSRNEEMAGFMRRCGICEERGSGYDKIIDSTSRNKLLAPKVENQNNQFTKVILFSKIPFELTTKADRIRTCYMQACLAYVNFDVITNTTIRLVFGLSESEKVKSSRIIKDTVEAGLIKPVDENTAPKHMKYIPFWA